jgi:hypothetical protein
MIDIARVWSPDDQRILRTEHGPIRRVAHTVITTSGRLRRAFRGLRRTRPFWAGLWAIVAGLFLIRSASFALFVALNGTSHWGCYLLGGTLVLLGLTAWVAPFYAAFLGLLTMLVALLAFPLANLGGYLVGTVLGLLGGAMMLAFGPRRRRRRRRPRRSRRSAGGSA